MRTTTIRITEKTHKALRDLADSTKRPISEVVSQAVELYERQRFWDEVNAGYARLRADPQAWKAELEERALWDTTRMDGLEDFPYEWDEDTSNDGHPAAPT